MTETATFAPGCFWGPNAEFGAIDGVSSKMLSEGPDDLESAGLVSRTLLSDQPVRVEYKLTERGRSLEPLVTEMVRWGDEYNSGADNDTDSAQSHFVSAGGE